MKTFARAFAALLLGVLLVPSSAIAAGQCTVTAADGHTSGACTYLASGPGQYVAIAPSGWGVEISKDAGAHWTFAAAAHQAGCTVPAAVLPASAGSIPSVAGDLVRITVATACVNSNLPPAAKYQVGLLVARDAS